MLNRNIDEAGMKAGKNQGEDRVMWILKLAAGIWGAAMLLLLGAYRLI